MTHCKVICGIVLVLDVVTDNYCLPVCFFYGNVRDVVKRYIPTSSNLLCATLYRTKHTDYSILHNTCLLIRDTAIHF